MGMNIDHIECQKLDAWMYAKDIARLYEQWEDELPEGNFLEDLNNALPDDFDPEAMVPLQNLWFYGEGSGSAWDSYSGCFDDIAKMIHGRVEAVVTWEGGDVEGLIIQDGEVTECTVKQTLVNPKTKHGTVVVRHESKRWADVASALGLSEEQRAEFFSDNTATLEVDINESLEITGGRVVPMVNPTSDGKP